MLIRLSRHFLKRYDKADLKIKNAFDKKLKQFKINPFHPLLNNHQLTGKYNGCRSINITGDWRAIYTQKTNQQGELLVKFELMGTHSELYG